jgi:hypothetical protein
MKLYTDVYDILKVYFSQKLKIYSRMPDLSFWKDGSVYVCVCVYMCMYAYKDADFH